MSVAASGVHRCHAEPGSRSIKARVAFAGAIAALAGVASVADTPDHSAPKRVAATVAYFSALQEAGAFTADEMAQRKASGGLDDTALAVDTALNDWKACVLDALPRWVDLHPGPGTIVDGAFGRCADVERVYRDRLLTLTQDGRLVVDMQLARSLMRTLEDTWRPRLIAAALDQELAARALPVPLPSR